MKITQEMCRDFVDELLGDIESLRRKAIDEYALISRDFIRTNMTVAYDIMGRGDYTSQEQEHAIFSGLKKRKREWFERPILSNPAALGAYDAAKEEFYARGVHACVGELAQRDGYEDTYAACHFYLDVSAECCKENNYDTAHGLFLRGYTFMLDTVPGELGDEPTRSHSVFFHDGGEVNEKMDFIMSTPRQNELRALISALCVPTTNFNRERLAFLVYIAAERYDMKPEDFPIDSLARLFVITQGLWDEDRIINFDVPTALSETLAVFDNDTTASAQDKIKLACELISLFFTQEMPQVNSRHSRMREAEVGSAPLYAMRNLAFAWRKGCKDMAAAVGDGTVEFATAYALYSMFLRNQLILPESEIGYLPVKTASAVWNRREFELVSLIFNPQVRDKIDRTLDSHTREEGYGTWAPTERAISAAKSNKGALEFLDTVEVDKEFDLVGSSIDFFKQRYRIRGIHTIMRLL